MRPPLAALALSALLVTSGCLGILRSAPSDPGAEAIVEEAVVAAESVETYRVENRIRAVGTEDGDHRLVRMHSVGVVDRSDRTLRVTATRDDTNRTLYVVGNTTYTECGEPWGGWGMEDHDEFDDDWAGHDPLGRQLTVLAESPVTWAGNETLRGTPIHVVTARPSDRTLTQFSENRRGLINLFGPKIQNATLRAWIATGSHRVLKTRLSFDLRSSETAVDSRMTTTFTDYGTPVAVTLPDEVTESPWKLGCPGS